jgi:arginine/lysine/ornithine decarboxylase
MLLVDNAHGAYLKFLDRSMHPMDLGATMCCDSAHKTLPALTGGAYLHINKKADQVFKNNAKNALAMFGSTSPSYLILQSLDLVNKYIADGYVKKLNSFLENADKVKAELTEYGYVFVGDERLKFTIDVKQNGYTGVDFAHILRKNHKIECEFADSDYVVLMLSPDNKDLARVKKALMQIERKSVITDVSPMLTASETVMSVREAMLSLSEEISVDDAEGRILASCTVSCPPAVPILMPGERINKKAISVFKYYGISTVKVMK